MKNKWRFLKIIVTVILFGFLLSFSLKRFSEKPVRKVSVKLLERPGENKVYFIDEKNVVNYIRSATPTGKIGDVDIPALEKKVRSFPSVDSGNVYLNLNGDLNVDIKQKIPVFRLRKKNSDFYVDAKGNEFPLSKTYSHPCMLVTGDVERKEYVDLARLVQKINEDRFSRTYFIGISKEEGSYHLLTSEGHYKVEIGNLKNIDFKVKGFKTFVEKYLVYQNPLKYKKISVRYDNQIVTTLNPAFKESDRIIKEQEQDLSNAPELERLRALERAAIRNR
ncbi:cell division protein FtsQ/DivIB [Planobacterium oryzisoli]|uniref:cell division protein FtsQ/DivIB n=1 Tax=Planobacterium oryzisoli TaxID=2771435 RepID=UPI001E313722|nr:cell division protein FtsQ [Planobacterium oryzisoli]